MEKELFRHIVFFITKSESKTNEVMDIVFPEKKERNSNVHNEIKKEKISNKKQEILDSLNYLKSKKVKTKQDKESIYTLEMVLRNMK
jgi:hypothetical protein